MQRPGLSESFLARLLMPLLVLGLLSGAGDLHSLLHQAYPAGDAGAQDEHHPEPAHLDHGSVDVPCLACLFGLKSQSRPEAPGAIAGPRAQGRLAATAKSFEVAELSYGLPLSRAPPLS